MNGGYELYLEGCELLEHGKYREAASRFMQSLGEMPHFKTFERLSECYSAMNDHEKAFEYAEAAYRLNPSNDKTALRYAESLVKNKNDILKAQNILTEILARNPSYYAARVLLDEINSKKARRGSRCEETEQRLCEVKSFCRKFDRPPGVLNKERVYAVACSKLQARTFHAVRADRIP